MILLCMSMNEDHYDFSFWKFCWKIFILIYLIEDVDMKENDVLREIFEIKLIIDIHYIFSTIDYSDKIDDFLVFLKN